MANKENTFRKFMNDMIDEMTEKRNAANVALMSAQITDKEWDYWAQVMKDLTKMIQEHNQTLGMWEDTFIK